MLEFLYVKYTPRMWIMNSLYYNVLYTILCTIYSNKNLYGNGPYIANIAVKFLFLELCGHIHFDTFYT